MAFRLETVCAGFMRARQERDYATIIAVARMIPEKVPQEDPKLLMWFGHALTRSGGRHENQACPRSQLPKHQVS